MAFDREDSAGYLVNHMARLFAEGLQQQIAPLGIVVGQFPILLALWQTDGVSQKQLLESLDIEQATLANTLNRMERDGLVRRTRHPADARAQLIWLTDRAAALRDDAHEAALGVNTAALDVLDEAERDRFMDFMRRVIAGMRA